MTLEQYLKTLAELKAHAERAVIQQAPTLERMAYDLLTEIVDDGFDVQNGRLVPNEQALRTLNTFTDQFLGAFTEAREYQGAVGQYLKNFKSVADLMLDFQRSQGVNPTPARLGAVQEIVINEIINRYSQNGLNPGFVQPLRQLLFANVTGGTSKTDARVQLQEFITGGKDQTGKLRRYLEQTAQQGVDSYTGAVNTRIMQSFSVDTLIMSGSLIATSSPQCRWAINGLDGIIDREDWPGLKRRAEDNGLIEGTTFDNLPFNKLHWGCRHEFTPAVLTESQRKKITSTPTNN